MAYHVLVKGKFTVAALETLDEAWETDSPALSFLQQMYFDKNTRASCNGYNAMFRIIAEQGPRGLTPEMMHEADKPNSIRELIKGRLRIFCFLDGDILFLTNGYLKASQKVDQKEVAKSIKAKNAYFEKIKIKGEK
jgi:hypothetical protein